MILEVDNVLLSFKEIQEKDRPFLFNLQQSLEVDTSGLQPTSSGLRWVKSSWNPYDFENETVPSGHFWSIVRFLPPDCKILDVRENYIPPTDTPENVCKSLGIQAREYQFKSVESCLRNQRGVLNIATNGGKTEIMAMLCLCFPSGTRTMIVAPDITSVTEICERFEKRGLGYSVVDAGRKDLNYKGITICSLQSLMNLEDIEDYLQGVHMMLWDECDFGSTGDVSLDFGYRVNAFYRFYLSGTPWNDSEVKNSLLRGISGGEIVKISNRYLIDRGYSAFPTVLFHSSHSTPQPSVKENYASARKRFLNKDEEYGMRIMESVKSHIEEGCVVLFENKSQGLHLKKIADHMGMTSFYLDGGAGKSDREMAQKLLKTGGVNVVIASSIWNRALDFPYPQHWFNAGGMKSSPRVKQKWGRALRKKFNSENRVWIHEFYNFGHEALEKHSKIRYHLAIEEGFEVVLVDRFLERYLCPSEKTIKEDNSDFQLLLKKIQEGK